MAWLIWTDHSTCELFVIKANYFSGLEGYISVNVLYVGSERFCLNRSAKDALSKFHSLVNGSDVRLVVVLPDWASGCSKIISNVACQLN
jgi:hypothetical protein